MGKIATTWRLMKESWAVLMRDKALIALPATASLGCILIFVTFVGPFVGIEAMGLPGGRDVSRTLVAIVFFCYYLCNFLVVIFFNAALVDYVVTRTRGGEPTLGGSLRAAASRLPQIAAWAVISATASVVLKTLSARAGLFANLVISLLGVGWAFVTYFVVPFLVVDRKSAFAAVGASRDLVVRTWGQQLVSNVSYGLIGFFLTLPAIVLLAATVFGAVVSGSWGIWSALGLLAFVYILAVGIVIATLDAIFGAVLYLFARSGEAPPEISQETLRNAIRTA